MRLKALFASALLSLYVGAGPALAKDDLWNLSTKNLKLGQDERILGFKISLRAAEVRSMPVLPTQWGVNFHNFEHSAPNCTSTVDAHAYEYVAALEPDFFNKTFAVIDRQKDFALDASDKFDVILTLKIMREPKERSREMVIPMTQLNLSQVTPLTSRR